MMAGDRARAVALLVSRFGHAVYKVGVAITRNRDLARDVCQQVFLEAYRDLGDFTGGSLRSWLLGIARHRSIDAAVTSRRQSDRFTHESCVEVVDGGCPPDETLDRLRRHQIVVNCVARLPLASREAVMLRFNDELSYEDAASLTGIRAATLQKRVSRALPLLRSYITAELCSANAASAD